MILSIYQLCSSQHLKMSELTPSLQEFISHAVISSFEIWYSYIDLSRVSACLLFIADSNQCDLSTHRGLFNYTLFLYVSINNPTDAIIHVVISVNRFKKTGVKL